MSTQITPTTPAIPPVEPTIEEIDAALTPLEEQEERDYEEMLCRLYEGRDDISDNFDDRRYWL